MQIRLDLIIDIDDSIEHDDILKFAREFNQAINDVVIKYDDYFRGISTGSPVTIDMGAPGIGEIEPLSDEEVNELEEEFRKAKAAGLVEEFSPERDKRHRDYLEKLRQEYLLTLREL